MADGKILKPSTSCVASTKRPTKNMPTSRPLRRSRQPGRWSHAPYVGGLGFGMKWDMGWMHDTLNLTKIPSTASTTTIAYLPTLYFHRKFRAARFRTMKVVHCKGSLLNKLRRTAEVRTCACCSGTCTRNRARSLNFMGGEFGQSNEWSHPTARWLLQVPVHRGAQTRLRDLNKLYRTEKVFL